MSADEDGGGPNWADYIDGLTVFRPPTFRLALAAAQAEAHAQAIKETKEGRSDLDKTSECHREVR